MTVTTSPPRIQPAAADVPQQVAAMAMRTQRIVGDLPYYILSCAGCASDFACRDDSCYQRASLRLSAEIAGWTIGTQPAWAHRCPGCQRG